MAATSQVRHQSIVRDPAVQGGDPVISGTRIPVHAVVLTWQAERNVGALLQAYPRLSTETLSEALDYYKAHRDEIDAIIRAHLVDG